jgi:hypothetical protein
MTENEALDTAPPDTAVLNQLLTCAKFTIAGILIPFCRAYLRLAADIILNKRECNMILPGTVDLQITARQAFTLKTGPLQQPQ